MSNEISAVRKSEQFVSEEAMQFSLEELVMRAVTEASNEQYAAKLGELERIESPESAISPEDLYLFQVRSSEYNLTVSLYSALTRKAVNAIDTVVRA